MLLPLLSSSTSNSYHLWCNTGASSSSRLSWNPTTTGNNLNVKIDAGVNFTNFKQLLTVVEYGDKQLYQAELEHTTTGNTNHRINSNVTMSVCGGHNGDRTNPSSACGNDSHRIIILTLSMVPLLPHNITKHPEHHASSTTKSIRIGGVVLTTTKRPNHNAFMTAKSVGIHVGVNVGVVR